MIENRLKNHADALIFTTREQSSLVSRLEENPLNHEFVAPAWRISVKGGIFAQFIGEGK